MIFSKDFAMENLSAPVSVKGSSTTEEIVSGVFQNFINRQYRRLSIVGLHCTKKELNYGAVSGNVPKFLKCSFRQVSKRQKFLLLLYYKALPAQTLSQQFSEFAVDSIYSKDIGGSLDSRNCLKGTLSETAAVTRGLL